MRRRLGYVLCGIGVLCILGAAGVLAHNLQEERRAEQAVQQILPQLTQAVAHTRVQMDHHAAAEQEDVAAEEKEAESAALEDTYLGILRIPALELELPVYAQWNEDNLMTAPCRYSGALQTGDLVIAGHNYADSFRRLGSLAVGSEVSLTDMEGTEHTFWVTALQTLGAGEVRQMLSGDWDLTLFTCTFGGQSRIAVRCSEEKAG